MQTVVDCITGEVTEIPDEVLTLDQLKSRKKADAESQFDAIFAVGFAPTGTMAGETLQVATIRDLTNWDISLGAYKEAVEAGAGSVEGAMFRTTSNAIFMISFSEGVSVLKAMRAWGQAMYQRSWELKDAIEAAADEAALDAIDVTTGWPA
jgi:hypothetical protein